MLKDMSWRMFEKTGNVDTYLLFKEISEYEKTTVFNSDNTVPELINPREGLVIS